MEGEEKKRKGRKGDNKKERNEERSFPNQTPLVTPICYS